MFDLKYYRELKARENFDIFVKSEFYDRKNIQMVKAFLCN